MKGGNDVIPNRNEQYQKVGKNTTDENKNSMGIGDIVGDGKKKENNTNSILNNGNINSNDSKLNGN